MTNLFCKLSRAYETLSDTQARRTYDVQWVHIRHYQTTQQEEWRRQAEKAATEQKKANEEKLHHQAQERELQERLQPLEKQRSQHEGSIFEANRVIRRLTAELKKIQDLDKEELRKQNERNSWWTYITAPVYGKAPESEEEKQKRESERLQRLATRSIKSNELRQREAVLKVFESALKDTVAKIAAERTKYEHELRAQRVRREEQLRKEERVKQEADRKRRLYEQQQRERQAEIAAEQARLKREELKKEALRVAKEVREAEAARERARVAREAELMQRQERTNGRIREAQIRAAQRAQESRQRAKPGTCQHKAFWPKIEGRHVCGSCHKKQNLFAFQCPGCQIIACAPCRQNIRNEKGGNTRKAEDEYPSWDYEYD